MSETHLLRFLLLCSYTGWSWVWLKQRAELDPDSAEFKQNAIVSAELNSNPYLWLMKAGL